MIIDDFQNSVANNITEKVQKNSVTPYIVGNALSNLAGIVGALKTVIAVNDQNPVDIDWQNDLADGVNTYAAKHGNEIGIVNGYYFNGETWQLQAADVQQTYSEGLLTTLTIDFGGTYPAKLILI